MKVTCPELIRWLAINIPYEPVPLKAGEQLYCNVAKLDSYGAYGGMCTRLKGHKGPHAQHVYKTKFCQEHNITAPDGNIDGIVVDQI